MEAAASDADDVHAAVRIHAAAGPNNAGPPASIVGGVHRGVRECRRRLLARAPRGAVRTVTAAA